MRVNFNRSRRSIILINVLLVCLPPAQADESPWLAFRHLGPDQGLSSSHVTAILQDQTGFLWIGTQDGLNRYDGIQFRIFGHNHGGGLSDGHVTQLLEDQHGRIWIGTIAGLDRYDPRRDRIESVPLDVPGGEPAPSHYVFAILEDRHGDIWIGTEAGAFRRRSETSGWLPVELPDAVANKPRVMSLEEDAHGGIWIGLTQGVVRINTENHPPRLYSHSSDDPTSLASGSVVALEAGKDGGLWVGIYGGGVSFLADDETGKFVHSRASTATNGDQQSDATLTLLESHDGTLWIGTENGGLVEFHPATGQQVVHRRDPHRATSLSFDSIWSLHQDRAGDLWVGTYSGGVNVSLKNGSAIRAFPAAPGNPRGLPAGATTSFVETKAGDLWVGIDGGGLSHLDRSSGRFRTFDATNSDLERDNVICLAKGSNGDLWIGAWGGGLHHFAGETEKITRVDTNDVDFPSANIVALEKAPDGKLWVGAYNSERIPGRGGVVLFDPSTRTIDWPISQEQQTFLEYVGVLRVVHGRRLVIGTQGSGLGIYEFDSRELDHFVHDPNDSTSLSHNRINGILESSDGTIWIATDDGLDRTDIELRIFERVADAYDLPDRAVKGIAEDPEGRIWISTGKGIARLDTTDQEIKHFTTSSGLVSQEFQRSSFFQNSRGEIFFGATRGFNLLRPLDIRESHLPPPVVLTELHLFDQPVRVGDEHSPLEQHISLTDQLELAPDQDSFSIAFAALDYEAPEANRYAFRLEGFDRQWRDGALHRATYTNLDPGNYTFRVKASNSHGVWNPAGVALPIVIHPPFWQTWWFRTLAAGLVLATAIAAHFLRTLRIRRQKGHLRELVRQRTAEIENQKEELLALNEQKNEFLGIAAHDLRGTLFPVVGYTEMLELLLGRENFDRSQGRAYLATIRLATQRTLDLLNDLLDVRAIESGSVKFEPRVIPLSTVLEEWVSYSLPMARTKRIELELSSTRPEAHIMADRSRLGEILSNLLTNAIKFTPSGGKVRLDTRIDGQHVVVDVTDSGLGLHPHEMPKLFEGGTLSARPTADESSTGLGLVIARKIVQLHEGKIWATSEKGHGSTFSFSLPLVDQSSALEDSSNSPLDS